jgi:hypothetical protein
MKAEDLMKPRFEIIADFPNNDFGKVGDILDRDWSEYRNNDETQEPIWRISDFPHLFRKLNWWEHRNIEDMPKRLISKCTPTSDEIFEIEEWDMERLLGWINKGGRDCCDLTIWTPEYGYFPVD